MRFFKAFALTAILVIVSSAAHADFFEVIKKVGQVAETVNRAQAVAEGRADPGAMVKGGVGGGKHGASHGGKHRK